MTTHTWSDPTTGSGRDKSRDAFNKKIENLVTLHAGTADPPTKHPCMLQVRTDLSLLRGQNSTATGWITLGKWATNLGMLRIDGSNALTADLDFDGKVPKDIENAVPSAAPTGTPPKRFAIKDGDTKYWVPAYAEF